MSVSDWYLWQVYSLIVWILGSFFSFLFGNCGASRPELYCSDLVGASVIGVGWEKNPLFASVLNLSFRLTRREGQFVPEFVHLIGFSV